MPYIPPHILIAFVLLMLCLLIYTIETFFYYRLTSWYYCMGPAIVREEWQTNASVDEVWATIGQTVGGGGLVGRESPAGFCFRQKTVNLDAWTRVLLRVYDADREARLSYEVRPFYSMGLMVFPTAYLIMSVFGPGASGTLILLGTCSIVFAIYKWLIPLDVKRFNRLRHVRVALAGFGLKICENCGYDLFGQTEVRPCPECGRSGISTSDAAD